MHHVMKVLEGGSNALCITCKGTETEFCQQRRQQRQKTCALNGKSQWTKVLRFGEIWTSESAGEQEIWA